MKFTLRLFGIVGVVLFSVLFALTFLAPETIEQSAKGFVKKQIHQEISDSYNSDLVKTVEDKASGLAKRLGMREDKIKQDLEDGLHERIAEFMARLCGYDCEKQKEFAQQTKQRMLDQVSQLQIGQSNLNSIIRWKYVEIVGNLKRDLRIFLGSTGSMFLVLLVISFFKPKMVVQLFLPAIFLFVATCVSAGFYLFGQDWFYAILYNDYMGWGYVVYISIIFGFLMDIAYNEARVTMEIFGSIIRTLSSGSVC